MKIEKLIFSSHNEGKIKEAQSLFEDLSITIISAEEAGVLEDVVEDGKTFTENALKKAAFVGKITYGWTIGDDSGICVVGLDGQPGIHSARYAGGNASGEELVKHLLSEMKDIPEGKRKAWFETVVILRAPNGLYWTFGGRVDGQIAMKPRGIAHPRLPYDSVFVPKGHGRTFAEMTPQWKNALSHRGQAFRKLKEYIKSKLS